MKKMNRMDMLRVTITEEPDDGEVYVNVDVRISGDNAISMRDAVEFRRRVVEMVADYNQIQTRALKSVYRSR